ncbi:hypothetical protein CN603_15820 [Bacillus toyonensis]|uniref:hypothetical protein n=1 Tax=Bacillus toyonensis TaxID=155322 RepID=UPI000BF1CC4C|nr:hypothetical protein [Bacillus toyonensis]PEL74417.1 hypothetical protein CN603_15820 [Bacillus toyonensis]
MTMAEIIYGAIGIFMGYVTAFITQKAKNDALKKDSEELALLRERGKNLATKEDIQEITKLQEDVKTTFQMKMEQQKAEINRISKEYELYTVKKHEYYPELYKNLELYIGKVKNLELKGMKLVSSIDFTTFDKEDISVFMSDKAFKQSDKERILSEWDNKRSLAIRDVEYILHRIEYKEAEGFYETAENFYYLHRLFFSDEISSIANILLGNVYVLLTNIDPDSRFIVDTEYLKKLRLENEALNKRIDELSFELFNKLKEELKAENDK